ncbi:MAG: hypothetical protein ACYDG2_22105, partial [Ruminiclostridium sp.]
KLLKVQELLTGSNMPKRLSKYLNVGDDAETSIKDVVNIISEHLSFKPTNHKSGSEVTFEEFKKIRGNYMELTKFKTDYPELYAKYSKMK